MLAFLCLCFRHLFVCFSSMSLLLSLLYAQWNGVSVAENRHHIQIEPASSKQPLWWIAYAIVLLVYHESDAHQNDDWRVSQPVAAKKKKSEWQSMDSHFVVFRVGARRWAKRVCCLYFLLCANTQSFCRLSFFYIVLFPLWPSAVRYVRAWNKTDGSVCAQEISLHYFTCLCLFYRRSGIVFWLSLTLLRLVIFALRKQCESVKRWQTHAQRRMRRSIDDVCVCRLSLHPNIPGRWRFLWTLCRRDVKRRQFWADWIPCLSR